jgi:hypothetical protein
LSPCGVGRKRRRTSSFFNEAKKLSARELLSALPFERATPASSAA